MANNLKAKLGGLYAALEAFFPYYINHALVALWIYGMVYLITGNSLAGNMAGSFFYIGREVRDREKLGYADWPGALWPIGACWLAYLILIFI